MYLFQNFIEYQQKYWEKCSHLKNFIKDQKKRGKIERTEKKKELNFPQIKLKDQIWQPCYCKSRQTFNSRSAQCSGCCLSVSTQYFRHLFGAASWRMRRFLKVEDLPLFKCTLVSLQLHVWLDTNHLNSAAHFFLSKSFHRENFAVFHSQYNFFSEGQEEEEEEGRANRFWAFEHEPEMSV